ncbi:MAG: hypothetical protein A2W91_17480 [Bacteroidetes bacterium GWF2_38_335]|nr:MAG: hypothetical protein A2W91_17480 [Bacteroidetes bacterium GWF2_38_335]OFY78073.1 MAG: hypothetical protein A2281_18975 [Bacteroidetes bacterium RIFOXYA12_FULL_38_20]HBS88347.1 hypothetical protein [Bacteroidales bacterium]
MSFFKLIQIVVLISVTGFNLSYSQGVTGKVTSLEDGLPMPGVNILVKGTKIGTVTDIDGKFNIKTSSQNDTLVFSFIGYNNKEIAIKGQTALSVQLAPNVVQLESVVVTALGIKREEKSLGYSVDEVKGDEVNTNKEVSVANSLSGKVAGLQVTATNGSAASSSRVVLRGNNSFNNNQALIVVDGVPIDNSTVSNSEDEWGGKDFGNGISDINPDDIESISVLKGASASALYGSRASNGVILITTKKGVAGKGVRIGFSTSSTLDKAYIHTNFQDVYGAGSDGKFETHWKLDSAGVPHYYADQASYYGSWGPKMDGQDIYDWDGKKKKFLPQPDNYKEYFRSGYTINNSVSIDGGSKKISLRGTISDLRNNDIIPGSSVNRTNIGLNTNINLFKRLFIQGYVSYVFQKAENRAALANSLNNPARNYTVMPRHISTQSLKDNIMNADGEEQTWYMVWNWQTNPFWNDTYELSMDKKDRTFGNLSANWKFSEVFNLLVRTAQDYSWHHFENIGAYNGLISSTGSYSYNNIERWQTNTDFLLSYIHKLNDKLNLTYNFGGNALYDKVNSASASTSVGLVDPYVYSIENSIGIPARNKTLHEKAVNSLYAFAQVDYKRFLFFDLTGRNDWSSTLPEENNSYFYPSISSGFVFTELLPENSKRKKVFPYGKIRASWAKVGNDTDPYQLDITYYQDSNDVYGTYGYIVKQIPAKDLKPEELVSREIGTDLRFFTNRIGLDFTYYNTNSFNQIVGVDVSSASGASRALINAGNIRNSGIELQLKTKPIAKDKWNWQLNFIYTKNNSEVIELAEGIDNLQILEHWGLSIEARPGHPYGDIVGYGIQRDGTGKKLVDENGLYLRTDTTVVLGNINADFAFSVKNAVSFKSFTLSFLIDARIGGEMFSGTNMYGNGYSGNFIESLEGREEWYASEEARIAAGIDPDEWEATGGYLAEGVYSEGTVIDGVDVSGQPNETYINPFNYWNQFASWTNEIHEPFVYDASFVKLRELSFSWTLPEKIAAKIKMKNASVSIIGRNLWLIYSKVPNVDPESFHTNGNGQGYELYSFPTRRSIGVSLNFNF